MMRIIFETFISAPTGLAEILLHDPQGVALAKVFAPTGLLANPKH